jgi:hypothetical protein
MARLAPVSSIPAKLLTMFDQIVDVASSGLDHPRERKFTINANHKDMCRFQHDLDHGYINLKSELSRHISHRKMEDRGKLNRESFPMLS